MNIIFYDGTCGLCHSFVQFILKHDKNKVFHFAPIEGTTAKAHLQTSAVDSIALVDTNGKSLYQSDAALAILQELGQPWKFFCICKWLPKIVRDWLYQLVAKNRHFIACKKECPIPLLADKQRFLP